MLDKGELVEFDTPINLIRKEGGIFRNMCLKSGNFSDLEALARAKAESQEPQNGPASPPEEPTEVIEATVVRGEQQDVEIDEAVAAAVAEEYYPDAAWVAYVISQQWAVLHDRISLH